MDSILADEPSVHTLPDSAESDSAPADAAPAETPAEGPAPASKVEAAPKPAVAGDDEADDESIPDNFEGFKRALQAARGDKRKARSKWQEVERERAMLEGELRALRQQAQGRPQPQQQQQATEPKPDLDDEFYSSGPGKFWETREQQLERKFQQRLIETDRRAMRRVTEDYDDAEKAFLSAAQANPALVATMRASEDPVGYAYSTGKELLKLQSLGATSYDDLEAKIRAKVEAEYAAKASGQSTPVAPASRPPIPKSNANARGSGVGAKQAWSGPRPLDDLFQ